MPSSGTGASVATTGTSAASGESATVLSVMGASFEEVDDGLAEDQVETEDDPGQDHQGHEDHERVVDDLGPGGPGDLAQLGPDLAGELGGTDPLLLGGSRGGTRRGLPAHDRLTVGADLALTLHQALHLSVGSHVSADPSGRSRAGGTRTPNRR